MVRNSIGVSTCENGNWNIHYVIRHDETGKSLDFFKSQHADAWYWALDGVFYNDELWVTLLCVRNVPKETSPFGFEGCGTDLARVSNLKSDPQKWKLTYYPLVPDGTHAYPSATTVIDGEYLYIFALDEHGSRPMVLTRIPLNGLENPKKNLQYLAQDSTWKSGLSPADAKHVMELGSSEMSVRYHSELKQWVAVLINPAWPPDKVVSRAAPALTGPWTDSAVTFNIPEVQKSSAMYDQDTFCYAAKEHPEFEKPGTLLFTYVCNTMKPEKLMKRLDIYHPKIVEIPMPVTVSRH
jgi:hypothetical protein